MWNKMWALKLYYWKCNWNVALCFTIAWSDWSIFRSVCINHHHIVRRFAHRLNFNSNIHELRLVSNNWHVDGAQRWNQNAIFVYYDSNRNNCVYQCLYVHNSIPAHRACVLLDMNAGKMPMFSSTWFVMYQWCHVEDITFVYIGHFGAKDLCGVEFRKLSCKCHDKDKRTTPPGNNNKNQSHRVTDIIRLNEWKIQKKIIPFDIFNNCQVIRSDFWLRRMYEQ